MFMGCCYTRKDKVRKQSLDSFVVDQSAFVNLRKCKLEEQYEICEQIGEGAFGQVKKVIHKATQLIRAVKVVSKLMIKGIGDTKLFLEFSILRKLDHPNIVKLYEIFEDQKNYYLVMEYLQGGELFDKIQQLKVITEKVAADYMKQILSAVSYCHSIKVVHQDLKPENILLETSCPNSRIKIIDFGTSTHIQPDIKLSKIFGTPYFIAPETLKGVHSEKCDVWACGVILYILLCGYPPFNGNDQQEILNKIETAELQFEPTGWNGISDQAKSLIRRMLTKDHNARISAKNAYQDGWIQNNFINTPLNTNHLQQLSEFHNKNKIRSAITLFIAAQIMNNKEKEELIDSFKQMDLNGDGQISRDELLEVYMKQYNKEQAILLVDEIFDDVDQNQSGFVDLTEFIAAASHKNNIMNKQKLEQTFKIFDANNDGYLDKDEMQEIMGGIMLDDLQWADFVEQCDTDQDGQISQSEFIEMLAKQY